MGQAKLKTEKPVHRAGPHGHQYFCRNRCGTVVWTKDTNEIFLERTNRPLWGWCEACRQAAIAAITKVASQLQPAAPGPLLGAPMRCATMFQHAAHEQCDGNPDGLPDPMLAGASLTPAEMQIRKDLAAFNAMSPEEQDATMLDNENADMQVKNNVATPAPEASRRRSMGILQIAALAALLP